MPATMRRPEVDPAFIATGATAAQLQAAVDTLNSLLAAKQPSGTAATDAELQAAVDALDAVLAGKATSADLGAAIDSLTAAINAKQDAATAATDPELAAQIATVNTALAAKQASATAATDAELASAVADLNTLLAAKQDAGTAATDQEVTDAIAAHAAGDASDAELAAAVSSLTASIATKQDAATAATDAELAAAIAGLFSAAPTFAIVAGLDTPRQNTTGKMIHVEASCGVVADPNENGHIYFDISPDNVDWTTYQKLEYVACRNTAQSLAQMGAGSHVGYWVPPGWWYRYRTYTAVGYDTPAFLFDSAVEITKAVG